MCIYIHTHRLSTCPSSRSRKCWNPKYHELKIVSADLATFLYREFKAYALFTKRWAPETATTAADNDYHESDEPR